MVLFFHIGMKLSAVVFLVGFALIFAGFSTLGVAMKTKDKPTPITAAQLSLSGPPKDNAYVHVTDYAVNPEYVVMTKEKASAGAPWSGAWLQIIPVGGRAAQGGKPIILKDDHIQSEVDVVDFAKHSAFDAIVSNGTSSVTDAPATPAGMRFPTISEKQAWIVEMKARPDFFYAAGLTLLGVLCCVGGVIPAYLQGRRTRAASGSGTGISTRKL